MNGLLVVMDIGDVLIRTAPMAQWHDLGRRSGLPWREIAAAVETAGIVGAVETGRVSAREFCAAIRAVLDRPALSDADIEQAWNTVLLDVEPALAAVARRCADSGMLLLASNTSPIHWQKSQHLLARAGVRAPAVLSFEVGYAKPSARFFEVVARADPRVPRSACYIDDRDDNVDAATAFGMTGWLHSDPAVTAAFLCDFLS